MKQTTNNSKGTPIDPQNIKNAIDGVLKAGWTISRWNLNIMEGRLLVEFDMNKEQSGEVVL